MALDEIPPWLSVRPTDFGSAAGEGARLDLSRATAAADIEQRNASLAMEQQKIGLEAQRIKADQANTMLQMQMRKQEADRQFGLQTAEMAVQTELKRQALRQSALVASQKFQQSQNYGRTFSELKAQGLSDEEAALKASFSTGHSLGSMGSTLIKNASEPPAKTQYTQKDVANLAVKIMQKDISGSMTPEQARAKALQLLGGEQQPAAATASGGDAFSQFRIVSSTGNAAAPAGKASSQPAQPESQAPSPVQPPPKTGIKEIDDKAQQEFEKTAEQEKIKAGEQLSDARLGIQKKIESKKFWIDTIKEATGLSAIEKARRIAKLQQDISDLEKQWYQVK